MPAYAFQQRFTAFEDILIRLLEISRIPRICHLGVPSCPGEEERDFFLRIAARQAGKIGEVFLVHAEDIVRTGIVRRCDDTGVAGREGDALLREHALGGRVHIVSDLFRGRCDRVHGDRLLVSGFADECFHDEFRHGGAADVAVADEENVGHERGSFRIGGDGAKGSKDLPGALFPLVRSCFSQSWRYFAGGISHSDGHSVFKVYR